MDNTNRELTVMANEGLADNITRVTSKSLGHNNKNNLKENLLANLDIINTSKLTQNTQNNQITQKTSLQDKKNDKGYIKSLIKRTSVFYDESDEESEEEEKIQHKKVQFNKKVEEMAQFYINETEISKFYPNQFIETIFIHFLYFIFGPIFFPLYFKLWGKEFMRNMGFWGKKVKSSHIIQIFYWCCFVFAFFLTVWIWLAGKDTVWYFQELFLTPAYIANIMVLIRYTTVCVKYGFFPPEYYNKWKSTRLTRTEVKSNFLLQGWIKPSFLVLDVYLKEIFQKYNLDVNEFKFQFVGKIPIQMSNSLLDIDEKINEDASRIRKSIVRRLNKENKLIQMIEEVVSKKRSKEHGLKRNNTLHIDNKDANNFELPVLEKNKTLFHKSNTLKSDPHPPKTSHFKNKFREYVINKVLPDIRKRLKSQSNNLKSKIKNINENIYEIKGLYLCRTILKDAFKPNLVNYMVHYIFVFIIWLFPFIFTYIFFFTNLEYFRNPSPENFNISSFNSTKINSTFINTTSNNNIAQSYSTQMNFISYILLFFSAVALVPPVYLNTMNLLYGLIDIKRKIKLMQIITELINSNKKENVREYPLLNITHGNTMLNWYYLRNIVLAFGQRFSNRLILQTSIFCIYIVLAIIISIMSLFGIFNKFISMCLGISFTCSVLINFIIILQMFFYGAQFNFFEFHHYDLMLTHKIFLDELMSSNKFIKSLKRTLSIANEDDFYQMRKTQDRNNTIRYSQSNIKDEEKFEFIAGNNLNSDLFFKIVTTDENILRHGESVLIRTSRILENLKEKIKIDAIVRPLKIFWVKADYSMVSRILALMSTGVVMLFSNMIKNIDFSKLFK